MTTKPTSQKVYDIDSFSRVDPLHYNETILYAYAADRTNSTDIRVPAIWIVQRTCWACPSAIRP